MDQLTANKHLICGLCEKCGTDICAGFNYQEFCDLENFYPCYELLSLIEQLLSR